MEKVIYTPRLKLTLLTKAERGSPEFGWCHQLFSDEKSSLWSIAGRSMSPEDTEMILGFTLPTGLPVGEENVYRVAYAVHRFIDSESGNGASEPTEKEKTPTEFIGLINLKSLGPRALALPEGLTIPSSAAATTLVLELSYAYLPIAWGKGYAVESLAPVFDACKRVSAAWSPFSKLYIRAIVNERNPASLRVMEKVGMSKRGVYNWTGDAIMIGGEMRTQDNLHIYGRHLLE